MKGKYHTVKLFEKDAVMTEMTYGERAVGLTFNPSRNSSVDELKRAYAMIIDMCNIMRDGSSDPEVKRLCAIAITEAQGAQMWAVKAATWETSQ
jgi:hypothetical protein